MRRGLFLLGILACAALTATAQGPEGVGATSRGVRGAPIEESPLFPTPWRFTVGYQFNRLNLTGTPFDTAGVNASISRRLFTNWFGVEGQFGLGMGNAAASGAPSNLTIKTLFVGGGPRLTHRGPGRVELWMHVLAGTEHFQFNQNVGTLNNSNGLAGLAGGGVDYRLSRNLTLTGEADEIETHFFGGYQRHFQAVSSLAFRY